MSVNVFFAARDAMWPIYEPTPKAAFAKAGVEVDLRQNFTPDDVDYIIYAPSSPIRGLSPYVN